MSGRRRRAGGWDGAAEQLRRQIADAKKEAQAAEARGEGRQAEWYTGRASAFGLALTILYDFSPSPLTVTADTWEDSDDGEA